MYQKNIKLLEYQLAAGGTCDIFSFLPLSPTGLRQLSIIS